MKRQGAKHKQDDLDDLPMSLVVYIVLGLLAIMAVPQSISSEWCNIPSATFFVDVAK